MTAIALVYVIGVLDDHKDASPNAKFIVLGTATLLAAYGGFIIDDVGTYAGVPLRLGWLAVPFTLFAVVGFTNAFNMIDGLDALASSIGIVVLSATWWIGYRNDDSFLMHISLLLIVILSAFLYYNRPPAKLFMGDSGSLTVGFVIALLTIDALHYISGATVLFIAAVPLLDTFYVMLRRKKEGRSIMQADRCHIHHLLFRYFNNDTRKTVAALVAVQAVISFVGIAFVSHLDGLAGLVLFAVVFAVTYRSMEALKRRYGIVCV
jgi:UDP-GlcNAc:undecaprenyl-phosphate GlcNAc-1-phosphate transferase